MERLKDLREQKWAWAVVGLVVGLALGLLYAWVLSPVEWKDASPSLLSEPYRQEWLRMAIDSYAANRDADLALTRYQALGDVGEVSLQGVAANPDGVDTTAIQNFNAVISILEGGSATTGGTAVPGAEPTPETKAGAAASKLIVPVCGATFLIGVLLAAALVLRNRMASRTPRAQAVVGPQAGGEEDSMAPRATGPAAARRAQAAVTTPAQEPLATFRTIYTLGDDLYDDSFSIESAAGDFLGECGVGIGDMVGVGEPKKVSALEVWLFDKNDIQTVTKVLMSRYAHNDDATRSRLSAKGDPILASSGEVIRLQTASLEVEARLVDFKYGEGPLPPESYFERVTIELRAWPRGSLTRS
jgi:hypothetical protein